MLIIIIFLQILIYFVCVTVAAVNAQWFGQMTSEIMADMHLIEQACGLGQDIGLSSNREAYAKLCETDPKYKRLSGRLRSYHLLSSLCNLCCIICNGYSLYYLAENLTTLWSPSSSSPQCNAKHSKSIFDELLSGTGLSTDKSGHCCYSLCLLSVCLMSVMYNYCF